MEVFRRLKPYYWPYRYLGIFSVVFGIIMTAIGLVRPLLLQGIIDRVLVEGRHDELLAFSLTVIGVVVVRSAFQFGQAYLGHVFGSNSVYRLRNRLYTRLQALSFSYYDRVNTGDLMARVSGDVQMFRQFLAFGFAELLNFLLLFVLTFFLMLWLDWQLTLIVMTVTPILGFLTSRFHVKVHSAFTEMRESLSDMSSTVQENITGVRTVKSFAKERHQIAVFGRRVKDYINKHMAATGLWSRYFPTMELMGNIGVLLLLFYGGRRVMSGTLTIGELTAFFSYVWFIVDPLRQLGYQINNLTQSIASGQRVIEILDTPRDVYDKKETIPCDQMKGHVRFENVNFGYEDGADTLIDINLDVPAGSTVGILGPTGSGKTSIVGLIPRYYDVRQGRVTIDGIDVRDMKLDELRSQVGIVFQETFLFSTTIRENIAFGSRGASMEQIIEAAKHAQAHEFIMELPQGYDTLVGERGMGLSGGQKQRIAIARALLTDPRILIFDDATASVDMETEYEIQQALKAVMKGRTTFIIAHRISSVKDADIIITLDKGRIVERGTHEELLQTDGQYRRVYDVQYKDIFSAMEDAERMIGENKVTDRKVVSE